MPSFLWLKKPMFTCPPDDPTIPTTDSARQAIIDDLEAVIKSTISVAEAAYIDKRLKSSAMYYRENDIPDCAAGLVDRAIYLHRNGWRYPLHDPELEEEIRSTRNMTFAKRMAIIKDVLRLSKTTCRDVLKSEKVWTVIGKPDTMLTSVLKWHWKKNQEALLMVVAQGRHADEEVARGGLKKSYEAPTAGDSEFAQGDENQAPVTRASHSSAAIENQAHAAENHLPLSELQASAREHGTPTPADKALDATGMTNALGNEADSDIPYTELSGDLTTSDVEGRIGSLKEESSPDVSDSSSVVSEAESSPVVSNSSSVVSKVESSSAASESPPIFSDEESLHDGQSVCIDENGSTNDQLTANAHPLDNGHSHDDSAGTVQAGPSTPTTNTGKRKKELNSTPASLTREEKRGRRGSG
ncbi:hypothetical protein M011DRAFT_476389 [Sporormia fimetaria CBS 119925]|uniref:Uncharacterized protein n=1 Tax=Sporormia fimetaria CBS 119925 TaxID=1340428 RepID=A0A6A6VGP6_9PLEO|nr:hypothetical protein M011DRAFT_476389 [Sporormia fimetaria CBS 119925]